FTPLLLQAARPALFACDNGPVLLAFAVSNRAEQAVAERVSTRQRDSSEISGFHDQVEIFETQKRGESNLVVGFVDHDLSVDFIGGRREEAFRHDIEKYLRHDLIFPYD